MNWGWKIALVYIGFAVMTVTFVVIGSMQKVNLVEEDYYEKEITYQEQIDKLKNAVDAQEVFGISYNPATYKLTLQYSGKPVINGKIHLFRPSDADKDMFVELKLDPNGQQQLNTKPLLKGLWVVKVDWESGGKGYYKSQQIDIQ